MASTDTYHPRFRSLRVRPWNVRPGDEIDYRWNDGTVIRFVVIGKPIRSGPSPFTRERRYRIPAQTVIGTRWQSDFFLYGGALEAWSGDRVAIHRPVHRPVS